MTKAIYLNDWKDSEREGMKTDFNIDESYLDGVEILLASYTYEDYEGEAFVLFRKDDKLYEINGSHCSCCGLEAQDYTGENVTTQWEPEGTSVESLLKRLNEGKLGVDFYDRSTFADELRSVLKELTEKNNV